MASINKTSVGPSEKPLEEPLNPGNPDDSQVLVVGNKDIILKYSAAQPHVDIHKAQDEDSSYLVTDSNKNASTNLWFDDVSPTSSNPQLSEEEQNVELKPPESTFKTIINTITWPIDFVGRKFSKGSIKGSVFTLMTATLGAGILSLPQAVVASGVYFSTIQLIVCAYLGYFTTMLLVQCADLSKNYSYMTLASATYGKGFTLFVKIVFFLSNWGFSVAFIVLSTKLITTVLTSIFQLTGPSWLTDGNSKFWPCIVMAVYGFPASLARTLGALRYSFLLGIVFVGYLTIVVIIESFNPNISDLKTNYGNASYFNINGFLSTFPISIFSFTCHSNVLDVYQELQRKSRRRMSKVLSRVMIIALILYVLVGVFGYLTFVNDTNQLMGSDYAGVILLAPSYADKIPMEVSLCFICISIIFTFPLNIKPTKDSLLEILYPNEQNESFMKHFMLTFAVSITSLGAALVIPSVSDVLTILGATTTPFLCFFFPSMFYFKYANYKKVSWKRKVKRAFAGFLIVFTFLLMIFGIAYFFYQKLAP